MDFENPLHLDDACKGEEHTNIALETLNGNETAEDSTRDKDRDISTFEKTEQINIAKREESSNENKKSSTTYEKLVNERPNEKIYDEIKRGRFLNYLKFQLPAKKYVYALIAVTGIIVVVLTLVIILALPRDEGNINTFYDVVCCLFSQFAAEFY